MSDAHPAEIQMILNKARHYGMDAEFDEAVEEGFTRLVISGTKIDLFSKEGKKWAPNVRIQGTAGPGRIAFVWSNSRVTEPKPLPTKPADSIPDADVLSMIPQSQMLTEAQLDEVLRRLDKGIEAAYPGIPIDHAQFGRGKLELVLTVLDRLYSVSSRGLNSYMSIVVAGLLKHLQAKDAVPHPIERPKGPVAFARR